MDLRVGQGYDVHRLVPGRRLVLGGEEIPFDRGLEGFSDADVLLHALGDAILGATGLGDLGTHFPPGDPQWQDADSDLTLIAEAPKIAPYGESIRRRIAGLLALDISSVGLKATTNEGLGAIGRGEGMAALAVTLVERLPAVD